MVKPKIIRANIGCHNNWELIENELTKKLESKIESTCVTFCEMYFYKNGKQINSDWYGIIHDPEDTHKFWPGRRILNNNTFMKSLPFCKGLFCMSKRLKQWLIDKLNPSFFVEVLYHPLSHKNLKLWDNSKFIENKKIYQIGNWLRCSYAIYKLQADNIQKHIIPFNHRTKREIRSFLKRDKQQITNQELQSVNQIEFIPDQDYDNLFENSVVFLNLYSSTCNNVIIECIKSNCPIIINRHESIEEYLGNDYPLCYDNLQQASTMVNNFELLKDANIYLSKMDKSKFEIKYFISSINNQIG